MNTRSLFCVFVYILVRHEADCKKQTSLLGNYIQVTLNISSSSDTLSPRSDLPPPHPGAGGASDPRQTDEHQVSFNGSGPWWDRAGEQRRVQTSPGKPAVCQPEPAWHCAQPGERDIHFPLFPHRDQRSRWVRLHCETPSTGTFTRLFLWGPYCE